MRLRELLAGVEEWALLRHVYDGSDEDAERRLPEIPRLPAVPLWELERVARRSPFGTGRTR